MNEQEAMETLERLFSDSTNEDYSFTECFAEALTIAIQALEEVQQYRAIGTPEELQDMKSNYFGALSDWRQYRKIGTLEECRTAREKQIPKKPKHTYIKHGKHTWKKNENGEIDDCAWDYDYHNGVVCEVCGETVCVHCNPDYMELDDCEEEHWSCSSCGKEVYRNTKYCDCGQKLDWSEESEENNE